MAPSPSTNSRDPTCRRSTRSATLRNRLALTPVAIREGHAFADTVFGNKPTRAPITINVPSAVFCRARTRRRRPLARRKRGKKASRSISIATQFRPMKATLSSRATSILMKLVVDRATDRVLGVHIVGEGAAEMVQMAAIAVKMGAEEVRLRRHRRAASDRGRRTRHAAQQGVNRQLFPPSHSAAAGQSFPPAGGRKYPKWPIFFSPMSAGAM